MDKLFLCTKSQGSYKHICYVSILFRSHGIKFLNLFRTLQKHCWLTAYFYVTSFIGLNQHVNVTNGLKSIHSNIQSVFKTKHYM